MSSTSVSVSVQRKLRKAVPEIRWWFDENNAFGHWGSLYFKARFDSDSNLVSLAYLSAHMEHGQPLARYNAPATFLFRDEHVRPGRYYTEQQLISKNCVDYSMLREHIRAILLQQYVDLSNTARDLSALLDTVEQERANIKTVLQLK